MDAEQRSGKDRRALISRSGGRRLTDPEPSHGTRARYQTKRCRCLPCKAAEATYRATLRRQHAHGKIPLGALVPATETRRLIAKMLIERFRKGDIAKALGLKRPILELHTDVITLRNHLKVRRLYRLRMLGEGSSDAHT